MNVFTEEDKQYIKSLGHTLESVEEQLSIFKKGVPVPNFLRTATIDDGIQIYTNAEIDAYAAAWDSYLEKGKPIAHFIPASGFAGRFFRDLINFLNAPYDEPQTNFEKNFFKHLPSFAFFGELNKFCLATEKEDLQELLKDGKYKLIVEYILTEKGLNFCSLPSALFKFHTDKSHRFVVIQKYLPKKIVKYYGSFEDTRTPIQESLIESAMVSGVKGGTVNVCFTVRKEHKEVIQDYVREFKYPIEKKLGLSFFVTLPCQKTNTDTIVVTPDNLPFRDANGNIMFQQAGHGALLQNLNSLPADVVFIKNIDNEAPDSLKKLTSHYKKALGGILLANQKIISRFLRLFDKDEMPDDKLIEAINYVENTLNVKRDNILRLTRQEQVDYLKSKLNRPLRVCGMVKNEEEQGGMPCWVKNDDGTISLQIIEYYQIYDNPTLMNLFNSSTHFNPVDIVCSMVDYKGKKIDLTQYADKKSAMVYNKNIEGQAVKVMELPGLWNGGMADWNTIFVEVPIKTFNPVKTVNDLLRHEHQNTNK